MEKEITEISVGLIVWQVLLLAFLILTVFALYKLWNIKLESFNKVLWTFIILGVPVIGALLFLSMRKDRYNPIGE